MLSFSQLISPVTASEFFSKYWETKPLLVNCKEEAYKKLMSLEDVDFLLFSLQKSELLHHVWFIKNGIRQSVMYINSDGSLNYTKVIEALKEGNTITLYDIHKRWNPTRALASNLEEVFGHNVGTNSYLTPPNSKGLATHFDTHDVFILQMDGEKTWNLYGQDELFPVKNGDTKYSGSLTCKESIVMRPGDILFLPRGYVHDAFTTNAHSLHLTVGIHVTTWADLLYEMSLLDPLMRQGLPIEMLLHHNASHITQMRIPQQETVDQALVKLRAKFSAHRNIPLEGHISNFLKAEAIDHSTNCMKIGHGHWSIIAEGETVRIQTESLTLQAPAYTLSALEHIATTRIFQPRALPGEISEESKLTLVRILLKKGLISVC